MNMRLGAAVVVALVMSACGSSGDGEQETKLASDPTASAATPSPEESPESEGLSAAQIERYLEDIFSQQPGRIARARRMTVPGSVADMYAAYRLAVANSNLDGGYPLDAQPVAMGSNAAEVCQADNSTCATFADFEVEGDKLASFSVDGKNLAERLVAGSDEAQPVPGAQSVEFLGAYKTVSDDALVVAIRLKAGDQALNILDSFYRARNGRQSGSANISGPTQLGARSSATYTMAFPNAQPGGTATLRAYVENGPEVAAAVEVR